MTTVIACMVLLFAMRFVRIAAKEGAAAALDETGIRRLKTIVIVFAVFSAGWAGCRAMGFAEETLRYRVTVEVKVQGRTYTGSGVMQMIYQFHPLGQVSPYSPPESMTFAGEAIPVFIPGRPTFFLTLENIDKLPDLAFRTPLGLTGRFSDAIVRRIASDRTARELPLKHYPLAVAFTNVNDLKSVVSFTDANNLSALYDTPSEISRIIIQVVNERATTERLAQLLPWVQTYTGRSFTVLPGQPRFKPSVMRIPL